MFCMTLDTYTSNILCNFDKKLFLASWIKPAALDHIGDIVLKSEGFKIFI